MIVPVGSALVVRVAALAVVTAGATGSRSTLILPVEADTQVVEAASLVVRVWLPGARPAKAVPAWYAPPSILYS